MEKKREQEAEKNERQNVFVASMTRKHEILIIWFLSSRTIN